jgi:hypothetical protein
MKKFILFIFTFLLYINLFAQNEKPAPVSTEKVKEEKPNPVNAKIDEIFSVVKNIDATIKLNQKAEDDLLKLNEELKNVKTNRDALATLINTYQISSKNLQSQVDALSASSTTLKGKVEKIVALLQNEHAGFNPEILKVLEDIHLASNFSNYAVLDNFNKISVDMEIIKNYIAKKPFDPIENKTHIKKLEELRQETTKYKFEKFSNDIDEYLVILSDYCSTTKNFANFFDDVDAKKESIRNTKLAELKKKLNKKYGFLVSQINEALVDVNYKYPYKATCTD